jgi:hypothetical protein
LGEVFDRSRHSNRVLCRGGQVSDALEQPKRLQDGGIGAHADAVIALLDTAQRWPGGEGALGHDFRGQTASSAGVMDVLAQPAQRAADGKGWTVRRRHNGNFDFH